MQLEALVGAHLVEARAVTTADAPFTRQAIELMRQNLELVQDSDKELEKMVTYPLAETLAADASKEFREDNLKDVAEYVLADWESGALREVRTCSRTACVHLYP